MKLLKFLSKKPKPGDIDFGDLRRLNPISKKYGFERGTPIDRYYIEKFLKENGSFISGHVLEVGNDTYSDMFGNNNVTKSDVLDIDRSNNKANIIADLSDAKEIESNTYDCIILTQVLQYIFEIDAAINEICRITRPGGTILITAPGATQVVQQKWAGADSWYWSFTFPSISRLFSTRKDLENVEIGVYGNVLSSISFMLGLASHELSDQELDYIDQAYPLVLTVKARKLSVPDS